MTSYWLLSVALYLTGLGLGGSPLVILSLCSLAPSYVISIFSFLFSFFSFFPFVLFSLPYVFLHKVVFKNIYISLLLIKKKKKKKIQRLKFLEALEFNYDRISRLLSVSVLGSKDLGTNVFRTLMCNVGKP